LNYKCMNQTL